MDDMTYRETDEAEIDLMRYIKALCRKWRVILLASLLLALVMLTSELLFVKSLYKTTATIFITVREDASSGYTTTELSAANSLAKDVLEVVNKQSVLSETLQVMNLSDRISDVEVSASIKQDTRMIEISLVANKKEQLADIATTYLNTLKTRLDDTIKKNCMVVVDLGKAPSGAFNKQYKKKAVLGFAVGFLLACFGVLALEVFGRKIQTSEDVENFLGAKVLCVVPEFKDKKSEVRKALVKEEVRRNANN